MQTLGTDDRDRWHGELARIEHEALTLRPTQGPMRGHVHLEGGGLVGLRVVRAVDHDVRAVVRIRWSV